MDKEFQMNFPRLGTGPVKTLFLSILKSTNITTPLLREGLSWKEFIDNHKFKIAIDFTSLISLMGFQLYIFVMINLDTRKSVFINATYSPDLHWPRQQFKNTFFDMNDYPSLCICDRDQIFQSHFKEMLKNYFRIKLRRIPYKSPTKNSRVERFHLSLKSEVFKDVVPINIQQTQRIYTEYKKYYNHHRPYQGISGKNPDGLKQKRKDRTRFTRNEHLGRKITSFDPAMIVAA